MIWPWSRRREPIPDESIVRLTCVVTELEHATLELKQTVAALRGESVEDEEAR